MNEIMERLEELCEQGEMVSRVSRPVFTDGSWYSCTLAGPFGFKEQFRFQAGDERTATALAEEASRWLYQRFLAPWPLREFRPLSDFLESSGSKSPVFALVPGNGD